MSPEAFETWLRSSDRQPLVMGVLNITPDSFSDAGRHFEADVAVAQGLKMAAAGAAILDVGGESTRPGSVRVPAEEQIRRIRPVLRGLNGKVDAILSVDTTLAAVAEEALDSGASIINDISASREDARILPLAAARGASVILMHMQGEPGTMQVAPSYRDVVAEVKAFLRERAAAAERAGIAPHRILLDPGIGFGKTVEHNLKLLRHLGELGGLEHAVAVGTSRKKFIGHITGEAEPAERVMGTAASVAWCVANGAAVVRVHDVEAMVKVVKVVRAILQTN